MKTPLPVFRTLGKTLGDGTIHKCMPSRSNPLKQHGAHTVIEDLIDVIRGSASHANATLILKEVLLNDDVSAFYTKFLGNHIPGLVNHGRVVDVIPSVNAEREFQLVCYFESG